MGASPYAHMGAGGSDNGNQREAEQLSYYNNFFFKEKKTFMVTPKEKIVLIFASLVLKGHV